MLTGAPSVTQVTLAQAPLTCRLHETEVGLLTTVKWNGQDGGEAALSEPARELPADSKAVPQAVEEARRGVITHLTVAGERVAAIVPESELEVPRSAVKALLRAYPWVRSLSRGDIQVFVVELLEAVQTTSELDDMAPLEAVIAAWRGTAEIHADPELFKAATAPLDGTDFGSVPVPS
jgi:hypothetical protein